jgi:hypothetical protein
VGFLALLGFLSGAQSGSTSEKQHQSLLTINRTEPS